MEIKTAERRKNYSSDSSLVEHLNCNQKVAGSTPVCSTKSALKIARFNAHGCKD